MDLEFIGEAQREAGRGLDYRTSPILTIFGEVNHQAGIARHKCSEQLFDWQQSQHAERAQPVANW
jgi:hypothetical protein